MTLKMSLYTSLRVKGKGVILKLFLAYDITENEYSSVMSVYWEFGDLNP